jgi:acyl carrier protein
MSIQDTVIATFNTMFDEDITEITTLNSVGGDSLDALEIVMELEDVHSIEIPDKLTERLQWMTVKHIAAEVKRIINEKYVEICRSTT